MDINDICINCFKSTGGEEVCMNCGYIQTDKPKQICHLYPRTVLNNRYLIGRVINNGGFGVVYKAYDMRLERVVAIKELLPTQNSMVTRMPPSQDVIPVNDERREIFEKLKKRFMKEARVVAQFSECNSIVRVFDFFESNNTAYLVMEYLDGMTFRQYIDQNGSKMDFDSALGILMPIMQALKVVHNEGVVHKDVSPDNIFICNDGMVKLIDFGAAQFDNEDIDADSSSSVILKVGYTPPEQYRTNTIVKPCSDIYSIGAVFYAVLSGTTPVESIDRIEKDTLQRLSKLGVDVPIYADKAIMKAMALKENSRFKSMDEFIDAVTGKKKAEFPEVEIRKKKIRNVVLISSIIVAMIASVVTTYAVKSVNSIVPKKSTTIELWYIEGNENQNKRWDKAIEDFSEFAASQNEELANTKVITVGIPEEEYETRLQKAFDEGNAPDIYQSVGEEFDGHAASLKPLYNEADKQKMSDSFKIMSDEFAEHKKIAVCFDMPVLYTYVNGTKNKVPAADKSVDDLIKTKKLKGFTHSLICNPESVMYASYVYGDHSVNEDVAKKLFDASKTFNSKGKYVSPESVFVRNKNSGLNSMYYIGMMSEFSEISNAIEMGAVSGFKVGNLTGENVSDLYVFPELWSISDSTNIVERNTANLFLFFLLCNYDGQFDMTRVGQDTYYLPMMAKTEDLINNYNYYSFIYETDNNIETVSYSEREEISSKTEKIVSSSKKKDSKYSELS